jgi:selenocysteine lyase/cysteine desulfurase
MQNQRSKFSIPAGATYLNCAYMSPLLRSVEKAGIQGIVRKRNPLTISPDDFFMTTDLVRSEFANLIHCPTPNRIVIIPSASYGLANVTRNIRLAKGDKIIVASEQFPSNYYPWQRLCLGADAKLQVIAPPDTLMSRGKMWNERILEAIDKTTRVVALGHVHWADGTRFELEKIRIRTREVGALMIIDGTQSVGAMPFDVQKLQPDALVCSGYKWLMGPYSIGLAYYSEYFDAGIPVEENWINRKDSEDFTGLVNYEADYQPGALRYEVGEHSNFILIPMLLAALKQINQWGPENIQAYCKKISIPTIESLLQKGFWIEDTEYRGHHLFGIRFPKGFSIDTLKQALKKKKISVSFRGDSMRISPSVYNSEEDFDKLRRALQ